MGEVALGKALKRSAAQAGDGLYITNTLGDAAAGLQIHQINQSSSSPKTLSDSEAELLFSVAKDKQESFENEMQNEGLAFQLIGKLVDDTNDIFDQEGNVLNASGFQHF